MLFLVVGGNLDKEFVFERVEHFFGEINFSVSAPKNSITEPIQSIPKEKTIFADVSLDAIFIAFKAPDRFDPTFFCVRFGFPTFFLAVNLPVYTKNW
jgi:zinc protease